jgi:hypothetical protein
MAADPFNSQGGYTVGIPPIPVIDSNGNITVSTANITSLNSQSISATGNITAAGFVGNLYGNITGNITIDAPDHAVLYSANGAAVGNNNFSFYNDTSTLEVVGTVVADHVSMGTGDNLYSTASVMFATTVSASANQILHTQTASSICSVDYTIIATDATGNTRQTSKLFASVLGTEVGYFEYGTIDVPVESPGVGDFRVQYDAGNVNLTVTPMSSNLTTYKIMITSYKE